MRNLKYLIFTLLLSIIFIPNVFAKENVEIKSISLVSKSDNTTIKSNPTFSGLEMNFDLAFKTKNDNAKYKIVIKNDTNIDYQISEDTSFNTSDYITYKYDVDSVLKAKSETDVYVTITYSKEVDNSLLVDGRYNESNKAIVQLLDEEGNIVNPKTNTANTIILLIIFITLITVVLLKKNKSLKYSTLALIIGIISIPTMVSAIDTIKLTMNVKVEIEKGYKVGYLGNDFELYLKDSELNSYDLSHAVRGPILYVGSVSEENKYTLFEGNIIRFDDKLYSAGETVPVKIMHYRGININSTPVMQSEGVYLASDATVTEGRSATLYWDYSGNVCEEFGYPFSNNDKTIMNFSEYDYDYWNSLRTITVSYPATFTMPNHDVLFNNYVSRINY